MTMIILLRFSRRYLHTIVSRDIIKPSSPTPSRLKRYNLSVLDQLAVNAYMPMLTFYPSSNIHRSSQDQTLALKNSLAETLTRYYPFAGRLAKTGPTYVDCNDEGIEFLEGCNDSRLSDFLQKSKHEDLDQLFPDDLVWYKCNDKDHGDLESNSTSPLKVQVNYFACGGVAVAVSLSHKIADGSSLFNFVNHWATVTRSLSGEHNDATVPINPHFIPYQTRDIDLPKTPDRPGGDCVTKSFVFPNSKLNDLKTKITAMTRDSGQPIMNPTRAEVITWLLHNRAVAADTKANSGSFRPTGVGHAMNIRNKLVEPLPETSVGNLYLLMEFPTTNENDLTPNTLIGEMRKRKINFGGIRNMETALALVADMCSQTATIERSNRLDDYYIYTVLYSFPTYGIDFGCGKPLKATFGGGVKNLIMLIDTPDGDGVEAIVCLERQDMNILQNDPELLAFC